MSTTDAGPRSHYESSRKIASAEAGALQQRVRTVTRMRLAAFVAAAVPLLLLETSARSIWPTLVMASVLLFGFFLWFVRWHAQLTRALERARIFESIYEEGLARLNRDWAALPEPPIGSAASEHPCANDIDLVGRASLAHLIGRVWTSPGRRVLERLLLDPFAPIPETGEELKGILGGVGADVTLRPRVDWARKLALRQHAVRVLAQDTKFREELEVAARNVRAHGNIDALHRALEWLNEPLWTDENRWKVFAARTLGILVPATTAAWFFAGAPGAFPLLGGLAAIALHRSVQAETERRLTAAEAGEDDLSVWTQQLELAEEMPEGSERLHALRDVFRSPGSGAAAALARLGRISDTAAIRRSALAHFPLVIFLSWDIHMLDWLERWHRRHAGAAGRWLAALGELEVLTALGGLAHDHPDWSTPSVVADPDPDADGVAGITAEALGHPLLDPAVCVRNDVEVPGPGRLLLVTGSNMAGKTTLLRALGVNQILALAGAPVAAVSFSTRAILPWCAMRVWDSLAGGVSYFLAELRRLKRVVDASEAGPTLFLLDEILAGTNSAERRTAARIVLDRLLATDSIGAVTTHDLSLGDSDRLKTAGVDVHFREDVRHVNGARTLDFDYRLRPGPATSRNALLLLEMVGLGSADGIEEETADED